MRTLWLAFFLLTARSAFGIPAFGGPGIDFPWANSEKQGFGTAYEAYDRNGQYSPQSPTAPISHVWFTIARGILTEAFYPRVDTAQTRDTQFLVTDGKTFLHQEQYDTVHTVTREGGAPLYDIENRDPAGRYTIHKTIWADPDSDTIIQQVRITRQVDGLQFYLLHKPAAANSIFGDSAYSTPPHAGEDNGVYSGWQGLAATVPFTQTSAGFVGKSDGFTDLLIDDRMKYVFTEATGGNVALTASLGIPPTAGTTDFTVFLFFAPSEAEVLERFGPVAQIDVAASRARYTDQWNEYLAGLSSPVAPSSRRRGHHGAGSLAETSVLMLKAAEDKTFSGAVIASPTHPWGESYPESAGPVHPERNAGYHVVWPRDLYHIAGGLLAAGDSATAVAILRRLAAVQLTDADGQWSFGSRSRPKRGSFPQNFWVDGRPLYGGYQADETAMPVLLAYRLWKAGLVDAADYWRMVHDAADFLVGMGPWTQNERWEEQYGISPNSASYVIASLVVASEMASALGDSAAAATYLSVADQWSTGSDNNLDTWTFTTDGKIQTPLGNGRYYERINGAACDLSSNCAPEWLASWAPDQDALFPIAGHTGNDRFHYESEIVDPSFLDLVRLGVRSASNDLVQQTLPVVDAVLKRTTPAGPGWYRYRYDAYGENGQGRLWPLLSGERIDYQIVWASETGTPLATALSGAIGGLEAFASPEGLFSEQVWDSGDQAGRPDGSARPLAWSHAEYLEVLRSAADGTVFEQIPSVRARYGKTP